NRALERLSGVARERVLGHDPAAAAPELAPLWAALAGARADGAQRVVALNLPGCPGARLAVRPVAPGEGADGRALIEALPPDGGGGQAVGGPQRSSEAPPST
ncbi:MAG TPA: hypothetical protein PKD53_18300, partial [Chloroflexaceae bacterium]|nr:hypothetical protein [Chloroflexaceae bacterium]